MTAAVPLRILVDAVEALEIAIRADGLTAAQLGKVIGAHSALKVRVFAITEQQQVEVTE